MNELNMRMNVGIAIKDSREKWYIQGHIGSACMKDSLFQFSQASRPI